MWNSVSARRQSSNPYEVKPAGAAPARVFEMADSGPVDPRSRPTWRDRMVIEEEAGLLHVTLVGRWLDQEESRQARQHLRETGTWRSELPVLMDLRQVRVAESPYFAEMRRRTEAWKLLATPPPRIAFLASPGASYGVARMLEQQWMSDGVAAFTDEADARAWLSREG